ncbi:MAG: Rpn family recombination-promoting nuclease/putative transposase [Planctomycetota bacterium]|jgi:hypothetical protein|nr:Rpn family recombination-promoting nuclease/putative transposase [Planctomycetota bacterium]
MPAVNKKQASTRKASSSPGHVHDRLFRLILQDSEVLTHLFTDIQALIERDKVKIWGKGFSAVNGEALVRLSSGWITKDLKEPRGDLVLEAPLRGKNQNATVVVIFEHQSTSEPVFSLRALTYLSLVYQDNFKKYQADHPQDPTGKNFSLPQPMVWVIFNGLRPWTNFRTLSDLLQKSPDFDPDNLKIPFCLIDLQLLTKKDIDRSSDPRVQVLLTLLRERDLTRLRNLKGWVKKKLLPLRANPNVASQFESFIYYILWQAGKPGEVKQFQRDLCDFTTKAEAKTMASALVDDLMAKGIKKGKAEGIKKGKAEGKAEDIIKLLISRFNSAPVSLRRKIQAFQDPVRLDSIFDAAVNSKSLAAFKNHL